MANPFSYPQCTWCAYQMAEQNGKSLTFNITSGRNGNQWYNHVTNCQRSSVPRANSIACYDDGGYGHVAYVKSVNPNGSLNIHESNWKGPYESDATIANGNRGSYRLQGFLYI